MSQWVWKLLSHPTLQGSLAKELALLHLGKAEAYAQLCFEYCIAAIASAASGPLTLQNLVIST